MKPLVIVMFSVLTAICSFGQKSPVKFGEIPMEDLKMTVYPKDSSAEAVVLMDYGMAYVANMAGNYKLNFERHTRIKILRKEGLSWADVSILLHQGSSEERVSSLKGATYNLENGKIVESKLDKDGIFKEKYNKYYNQQKFTMPNVKEGSIIEYTYRFTSEDYSIFPNWTFQRDIPVRWSEYWALIPDVLIFEKYMQGYITPTTYETKSQSYMGEQVMGYHWIVQNAPAFKSEPYMTTENDYISRVNFALSYVKYSTHTEEIMGTWEKFNADLLKSEAFGKVIEGSGFLEDQVQKITSGITEPEKKIKAISDFIKSNIEWNEDEDYLADPLKKVMERKKGSAGDINLLLASMIQKAGIDVDMVILSTRDHGFIRKAYPMRRQFNYVVCLAYLTGKTLLLDATEKYLPYDILPKRCLNGQGLIVSANRYGWIDMPKVKARTVVNANLSLLPDGELGGNLEMTRDSYDAHDARESYFGQGEEAYVKKAKEGKNWVVDKTEFQNMKEFDKSVKEIHSLKISEHSSTAGDVIYINPFVTTRMEENPFKLEKREYPVDYGNVSEVMYMLRLVVPEGYAVDELPKSKVFGLPGNAARYMYNMTQTGNVVNLTSSFQINKALFSQEEYPNLREFYNLILAKEAEQIVIKKK